MNRIKYALQQVERPAGATRFTVFVQHDPPGLVYVPGARGVAWFMPLADLKEAMAALRRVSSIEVPLPPRRDEDDEKVTLEE